jgi:hypothetical protein
MTPELAAGWSALVAAAATVVGMIALLLFFSRGQPWGSINDAASVVLMLALIPVALFVALIESAEPPFGGYALAVAAFGIAAMTVAAVLQALLVAGRVTYEQTRLRVLGAGAAVGLWYVLVGAIGFRSFGELFAGLAIASGIGFIAVGYGFAVGGERHPLSVVGGLVAFVASTAFLAIVGLRLVLGDLAVRFSNA